MPYNFQKSLYSIATIFGCLTNGDFLIQRPRGFLPDLYYWWYDDDNDNYEADNDNYEAENDNGGEMEANGRKQKGGKEVIVCGKRLANIHQLLNAYLRFFFFSDDKESRIIYSFYFLLSSTYFHLICASWKDVIAI